MQVPRATSIGNVTDPRGKAQALRLMVIADLLGELIIRAVIRYR